MAICSTIVEKQVLGTCQKASQRTRALASGGEGGDAVTPASTAKLGLLGAGTSMQPYLLAHVFHCSMMVLVLARMADGGAKQHFEPVLQGNALFRECLSFILLDAHGFCVSRKRDLSRKLQFLAARCWGGTNAATARNKKYFIKKKLSMRMRHATDVPDVCRVLVSGVCVQQCILSKQFAGCRGWQSVNRRGRHLSPCSQPSSLRTWRRIPPGSSPRCCRT